MFNANQTISFICGIFFTVILYVALVMLKVFNGLDSIAKSMSATECILLIASLIILNLAIGYLINRFWRKLERKLQIVPIITGMVTIVIDYFFLVATGLISGKDAVIREMSIWDFYVFSTMLLFII